MSSPEPARELLGERLVAAGLDEQERAASARRVRPNRRRTRRLLGALVAASLAAGAVAGAAELISTGEPVRDPTQFDPRARPARGQAPELVAKAPDPAREAVWGVAVYTSAAGKECVLAGQVRGLSLGLVRDGRFHPYERGTSGICASPHLPAVFDRLTIRGAQPRTVVFGLARSDRHRVTATLNGRRYSTRPVRGAFLFVFAGSLPVNQPRIRFDP